MGPTGDPIRVLHVDDEPDFADLAATFLEREDPRFDVETATNASDGLDVLASGDVDCVVSDHDMPGRDGIEFLEVVRERYPDLPFVLFTGKGSEEIASDAISAGVTDYLQKGSGTDHYPVLANRISNAVESYRAEREVERTRAQLQEISEHSADAIVTIDSESRVRFANPAVEDLFGYVPGDLEGGPLTMLMPERFHDSHLAAVGEYLATGERTMNWSNVEFTGRHRDGTEFPVSVSFGEFTRNGDRRFIGIIRDDSERTPATADDSTGTGTRTPASADDEALSGRREREWGLEFFEEMIESIGVGVAAYGEDGVFEYVNDAFAANLDTDRETLEGKRVWDVNPLIDPGRFADYWASIEHGETRTTETVHAFEGREVLVETVTTCTEIGGATYHFGTARDVTERKEREQRFQAFVEQSNDILTVLDESGTYKYQSPSAERILGYERGELVGEDAFEYVHPDDRERVVARFQNALEETEQALVVEYRFRHADGSWRWLESRGFNRLDNLAVEGFVVNSRDVTERKRHERQVAALHDATREMVQATDEQDVCELAVRTAETILDHPVAGVWLSDDSGERLEPVASTDASDELFGDHPVYTEGNSLSWRAYAEGDLFVVDDLDDESGQYNPDSQLRSELIIPLGEFGVLNLGATEPDAFTDSDVALAKLLGANTQTALGRTERARLLERHTDQMEFFNSILRHDVLNAVTVIRARAEFLADDLEGDQLRDAETILRWSDDVQEIVQRVRTVLETLTGEGDPELEPVDITAELRSEIERLEPTYPEVTFELDVPEGAWVRANDLLGDVLGNVVTNAVEHNDTDGLRVSCSAERGDGEVVVRIADNGQGVADDRKEAIFRRGETGHAKSIGSGFGLFFVDAMVAKYGGDVRVEDNEDGGATVVLVLPAPEEATDA